MREQIGIFKFTESNNTMHLDSEIVELDNEEIDFVQKQLQIEISILENMKAYGNQRRS